MSSADQNGHNNRQALQNALLALKKARLRIEELEKEIQEPVAVVGMACRFPGGADSPEAYWQLLHTGVDAIREVPPDRWNINDYYGPDPGTPGKMCTRWGGFLREVDTFDAPFFGISPREAVCMDPQHRLALEVGWEALENAGLAPDKLTGSRTGVFMGISTNDYCGLQLKQGDATCADMYMSTGNASNAVAGRLSYLLGLQGPSIAIDTACSSSLVAVYLACQSLDSGDSDLALAGGVNLVLSPEVTVMLSQAHMMAPDGRCKAFDATANGFVRGEGCGVVVLKRLSAAIAAHDPILAVIRGWACNQDGRSSGLTAPNGVAQQAVIRQALARGGVKPAEIDFVETHGTGTALGDPIEVQALGAVLSAGRSLDRRLILGSAKTNIGHLEAAAGVAGLIKTVLALQHGEIPPHLHLKEPNPYIDWEALPVTVATTPTSWPTGQRLAGVSSFGFTGTNAHVIVEAAPVLESEGSENERPLQLLTVSAQSKVALGAIASRYREYLNSANDPLADVCYTAATGRVQFPHRLALVAQDKSTIGRQLAAFDKGEEAAGLFQGLAADPPTVAFLFTGQGAQYVQMGRQLYEAQPLVRQTIDECDELLRPYLAQSLLSVLYPQPGQPSPINDTAYTQPALFALEVALARLWQSWGVQPTAVLGHSVGEIAAAHIAGVFSLEDGLKLIAERGRQMQALPPGGTMAALFMDYQQVKEAIAPYADRVSVAAVNGPHNIVISGEQEAVEAVIGPIEADGIRVERLTVSHAFHSHLMEPMLDSFTRVAEQINPAAPQMHLIANVTGQCVSQDQLPDGQYWRRHAREAVQFAAGMDTLQALGCNTYIEIGPRPTLLGMGRKCLADYDHAWLPSLRKGHDDWQQLLQSLGTLYTWGLDVNWQAFYGEEPYRRVSLPNYPFQRQRYWLKTVDSVGQAAPENNNDPLSSEWLYQVQWECQAASEAAPIAQKGRWLIFADQLGVGQHLASLLDTSGHNSHLLYANTGDDPIADVTWHDGLAWLAEEPGGRIVHLWSLDATPTAETTAESLLVDQADICGSVLRLVQAIDRASHTNLPRLWLVTQGAQSVLPDGEPLAVSQSSLWGLGRVIALEHSDLWGGQVDLDLAANLENAARMLLTTVTGTAAESLVAFRQNKQYVARLVQAELEGETPLCLQADATYLITGGTGGLGLEVAQWLVAQGARHLVLLSRNEPGTAARQVATALEDSGAEIIFSQADVSRCDQVARVLADIDATKYPLRGIIHAAGIHSDGLLTQQTWSQFAQVLQPKLLGAWHLHTLTREVPLDFFVLFSSTASILGSVGQGNYAAANAFLDALAHHRRDNGLAATTINWGPWAEVGMAARLDGRNQRRWSAAGITALSPKQGIQALADLLNRSATQIMVLPVDWPTLTDTLWQGISPSFLASLANEKKVSTVAQSPQLIEQYLATPVAQRSKFMLAYLRKRIGLALGVATETVPEDGNVWNLGLDSLMVMELLNACRRDLQITLYPREFYERPSLEALATYITTELEQVHTPDESDTNLPTVWHVPTNDHYMQSTIKGQTLQITQNRLSINGTGMKKSAPSTAVRRSATRNSSRVVFLLSSPRSGSTLLRVMLAGHPALFCPPELHLLPFADMSQRNQELGQSYLDEGLQRAIMELKGIDATASKELLGDWLGQNLSVQAVYTRLQQLASPRLLVDKSPTYAGNIETLLCAEELFADARYIYLTRHPYAVIDSFASNRMHKIIGAGEANPHSLAEQIWAQTNLNILDFLQQVDPQRQHVVRYEDLVCRPHQIGQRLCEFLELPMHEAILSPYEGERMTDGVHSHSLSIGDPNFLNHSKIDPAKGEAWQQINLPFRLSQPTCQLATRLGYTLPVERPLTQHPSWSGISASSKNGAAKTNGMNHQNGHQHQNGVHRQESVLRQTTVPMREFYVDVRGLTLCLCAWGPAEGPTVLLLHGMLDQGAMWSDVAQRLVEKGYRVLAPDQRGHGRSQHAGPGGSYHLLEFVADLDALLGHNNGHSPLQINEPITLVGHSMGAAVAALYAGVRPKKVGALVLVESILPVETAETETVGQLTSYLDQLANAPQHNRLPDIRAAAERLRRATPSLAEENALQMARRITQECDEEGGICWCWDPQLLIRTGVTFNGLAFKAFSYTELLRQIRVPVTLVYGQDGSCKTLSQLREVMPDATGAILPGGHNLHIDAPEALADIVLRNAPIQTEKLQVIKV